MEPNAWRCSQCGTVNEPGSRSCSECGRWPSLFDLQDSVVDGEEPEMLEAKPVVEPQVFVPDVFEPESAGGREPPAPVDRPSDDEEPMRRRWVGRVIPLLIFLVVIIVNLLSNRG